MRSVPRAGSISYDDIRLVAAITEAGTIRGAQRVVGGHLSTLYRQLRDLEARAGGPLFENRQNHLLPTARAAPIVDAANDMLDRLAEIERGFAAQDDRVSGPLRVTTADSLQPVVCECLLTFRELHPDIAFSLQVDSHHADLGRREADVAIRPTRTPPETLVGRRVATFEYATFSADGAEGQDRWIVFEGEIATIPAARWLEDNISPDAIALRVNAMTAAASAAAAGWGKALLPTYLAGTYGLLQRSEPIASLRSEVWLLYHQDLRSNPRVRAFSEFAAGWLRSRL